MAMIGTWRQFGTYFITWGSLGHLCHVETFWDISCHVETVWDIFYHMGQFWTSLSRGDILGHILLCGDILGHILSRGDSLGHTLERGQQEVAIHHGYKCVLLFNSIPHRYHTKPSLCP